MRIVILICALFLLCACVVASNVTIRTVESNYIIWSIANNTTSIWIDGTEIPVYGPYYGQYGLSPGSFHVGCGVNETICTGVTTPLNGMSVLIYWSVFAILIGLVSVSYFIPLTAFPTVIYGGALTVYLNSINAPFEQILLCGILIGVGILAGIVGWRKL